MSFVKTHHNEPKICRESFKNTFSNDDFVLYVVTKSANLVDGDPTGHAFLGGAI